MNRRELILAAAALAACAPKSSPKNAVGLKVLVLGGTRFLGPAFVEAARARGHVLTLFNRGKTRPDLFPGVEKLRGDRDGDLKSLEGREWDAVLDTSGFVPRIVKMSAELLAPKVKQYIFISTISVYGEKMTIVNGDESMPLATMPDPASEKVMEHYGALKALCEQAAEKAMPGRVTNVRPGFIVGRDDGTDRFTYWPVRIRKGGEVLAPGDGTDPVQYIDVRDLGEWLVKLVETKTMGTFNAVGPGSTLTTKEFLETCKSVTKSDATLTWVPWPHLEKVKEPVDTTILVPGTGDYAGFSRVSAAKAREKGLTYRPLADTIADTLRWFDSQPEDRRAKLRAGIPPETETAVLAEWKKTRS